MDEFIIIICYKLIKEENIPCICQQYYIIICFIIQVTRNTQIIPKEYYNITRVMWSGFSQRANLILLPTGKVIYYYIGTLLH